jgi:hypothetical protein
MIPLLVLPIAKQGIRHQIISSTTQVSWNRSSSRRYGQSDCRGIAAEHHQKYQPSNRGFGRGTGHHREILDWACGCFDTETFTDQRRALRL